MAGKLKLKPTKEGEQARQLKEVRELMSRSAGVPYHPSITLLGGSFVGIKEATQAKQIRELLERTIVH